MKMIKINFRAVFVLVLVALSVLFLSANSAKDELERIKKEIEKEKKAIEEKTKKQKQILAELEAVEKKIRLYDQKIKELKGEQRNLEQKLKELEKETKELQLQIDAQKKVLSQRLRARYEMGEVGVVQVLFSSENLNELVLRDEYLGRIVEADEELIEQYQQSLSLLSQKQRELKEKQAQLKANISAQSWAKKELEKEKKEKKKLIERINKEKQMHLKAIAELDSARRSLERKLFWIARKKKKKSEFEYFKSRLCLPCKGEIEEHFGERIDPTFHTKTFHKGIDIRAPRGTPVRAIYAGEVVYADWFRGYGNLVIIDHGSSYYSLYAHLDQIICQQGEVVNKGDKIGYVGDTGSLKGTYLYFELRHHSKAIDPEKWLNTSCVESGE